MSLAFSRRSFLKYSAVAAVAVAGASLFSGCDQTDTKNLYCDGAGSITVLQINAVLGTYDDNAKKYKDIDLTGNSITFPFQITVGRTNNLPIQPSNFKAIVYGKDGKQKAKYVGGTSNELKIDASLLDTNLANSAINKGTITLNASLAEGEKLVFTPRPAVCRVFHELGSGSCCERQLRFHLQQVISPTYIPSRPEKPGGFFAPFVLAKCLNFSSNFQQFCILCTPAFSDTIGSWKRRGAQRQGPQRCLCFRSKRPWAVV